MGGAALFTLVLIAVLVAGTYLLQLILWLAYAALVAAYYVGCLVFSAVWAVLDWRGFRESLRRAEAERARERLAPRYAR